MNKKTFFIVIIVTIVTTVIFLFIYPLETFVTLLLLGMFSVAIFINEGQRKHIIKQLQKDYIDSLYIEKNFCKKDYAENTIERYIESCKNIKHMTTCKNFIALYAKKYGKSKYLHDLYMNQFDFIEPSF